MPRRDLVVVGASAGGVEALRELVRAVPGDLPATVLIVLHLPTSAFSALPAILDRAANLPVGPAYDGAPLLPGHAYVATPDRHLLVREDLIALGDGPRENGHRPAIDPLFRSAARWRGQRAVGVILSGTLDDGASGLMTIADRGGASVVQDPASALYDGMPRAALRAVPDARQGSPSEIAKIIAELVAEDVEVEPPPVDRTLAMETEIPDLVEDAHADAHRPGRPAAMTCPDCNGAMFMLGEADHTRFRCRVGHAWSPEALIAQQDEAAEAALWAAVRSLEERAALHRTLGSRAERNRYGLSRHHHLERAREASASAAVLRDLLRGRLARLSEETAQPDDVGG